MAARNLNSICTAAALAASLVTLGVLVGCGDDSDPENQADEPTAPKVTGSTGASGPTYATGPEDRSGSEEVTGAGERSKGSGGGKRGRDPASAYDRRGKAPDDVISDRPGGPGKVRPAKP